jgi:hypothetical protein
MITRPVDKQGKLRPGDSAANGKRRIWANELRQCYVLAGLFKPMVG